MDKFLIKKIFHNNRFNKQGIALFGERASGKTLQLVQEAHLNDGILVIGTTDTANLRLRDLKIKKTNMEILEYQAFAKGKTLGIDKPIYLDEIEIFMKNYKIPNNEAYKICGYTTGIDFEYYNNMINEEI